MVKLASNADQIDLPGLDAIAMPSRAIKARPKKRGGKRTGAGRKPRNPLARPNVSHRVRPVHKGRLPVHVTMRAKSDLPSFRVELVRNLVKELLKDQTKRLYAEKFQVVHFSIQDNHLHLIVEAGIGDAAGAKEASDEVVMAEEKEEPPLLKVQEVRVSSKQARANADKQARDTLRSGVSGFAIAFARRLNALLKRKGKVWGDRHHRRDLESPTEVRSTILYVLQNYVRHGTRTFGAGVVDMYSSAMQFTGWSNPHVRIIEEEPFRPVKARTWLLSMGWTRGGGLLKTSEQPPAARTARVAPIVSAYEPHATYRD